MVGPGGAVEWNPSGGANCRCPGGCHTRGETSATIRLSSFNTSFCRDFRAPRAEADTDRMIVFDDCKQRSSTSFNFGRCPTAKIRFEQSLILNNQYITWIKKCGRKLERRPVRLVGFRLARLAYSVFQKRDVTLGMYRRVAKIPGRWFVSSKTFEFSRNLRRNTRANSPRARTQTTNKNKQRTGNSIRLPCRDDAPRFVEYETRLQMDFRSAQRLIYVFCAHAYPC